MRRWTASPPWRYQRSVWVLGVENRNMAVKRARELGVLPTQRLLPDPGRSHIVAWGEQSRSNHPGEPATRMMTTHPARRKPRGGPPSASHDHSGTTKARPPHVVATGSKTKCRIATASAAIDEIREGNQGMRSHLRAESPAQDRILSAISAGSSSRAPSSVDVDDLRCVFDGS
jgi:hypothetical protein